MSMHKWDIIQTDTVSEQEISGRSRLACQNMLQMEQPQDEKEHQP